MTSKTEPKFRASYTVLSLWASGRWQDAISTYFKLERFENQAMRDGKEWHNQWEEEVKRTGRLPEIFGAIPLSNPVTEMKHVVPFNKHTNLVFVVDLYDEGDIHEYKSGVQSSGAYARDKQIGIYAVGALLSGLKAKRLFIHHYDQYARKADTSMVWVTEQLLRDTVAWVDVIADDMNRYLLDNDLYTRFGNDTNGYGSTSNVASGIEERRENAPSTADVGLCDSHEGSGNQYGDSGSIEMVDQPGDGEDA